MEKLNKAKPALIRLNIRIEKKAKYDLKIIYDVFSFRFSKPNWLLDIS